MKNIKFITTFSNSGYHVYGKSWIQSFLEKTKNYPNITAKIYVNGMDLSKFNYDKIEVVDYDIEVSQRNKWAKLFNFESRHDQWNKDLALKFSFKSFVMLDALKKISDGYVIWLDADCVFIHDNFDNWPENLLNKTFIACQRESGSEHIESGIIIFDSEHKDKEKYIDKFESLYMLPSEFNNFGQFFDGFAVGRTLNTINIPYVDLNKEYGIGGIQSDPNCTFLNPEIQKRFVHNIGISGKRRYDEWEKYKGDPFFQLIHGVNDDSPKIKKIKNIQKINNKLNRLVRK
jgi:hypothetical protein